MTQSVKTVTRELTVRDLSDMFERDDFNAYPVEDDAQVIGIVTKFDLLKCFVFTPSQMVPHYEQLMNRTVADVMTSEFIYVRTDTKLTRVLQLMIDHRIRSVPAMTATIDWQASSHAGMFSRRLRIAPAAKCRSDPRSDTDHRTFMPDLATIGIRKRLISFAKSLAIVRWSWCRARQISQVDFDQIVSAGTVVV